MKSFAAVLVLLSLGWVEVHPTPEGDSSENSVSAEAHNEREASNTIFTQLTGLPDIRTEMKDMSVLLREQAAVIKELNESVEELKRERKKRVAFSTTLLASGSKTLGPHSIAITLVYKRVIVNIGNGYNPITGLFTAPVRGVYHFFLHVWRVGNPSAFTSATLHKNGHQIFIATSKQSSGYESSSNGASLLLEVGDVVQVKLYPGAQVHDSHNHHCSFSGHLLFAL